MDNFAGLHFDNSYARLPGQFYESILPEQFRAPSLIKLNETMAEKLGLNVDQLKTEKGVRFFAGQFIAPGSSPIALAYSGHQFGRFVPTLGDGRAHLLGEMVTADGERFDLQLKGSGRTSFSRSGDGRAALGPVMREYIISEAMHALNVKTTRALAFVTTGESVQRETSLPGAILTRVASSHIRVGTFEYFAARNDWDSIKILSDYTINRHYPECLSTANPYIALLKSVINSNAQLIASWMAIGFIHGVMNTDNTLVSLETIDYGPCAFMDEYDPQTVFSSIDKHGRYAYANQPTIGKWNMGRFAQTILPLLDQDLAKASVIANELVETFDELYHSHWLKLMSRKLGLFTIKDGDDKLIQSLLNIMQSEKLDFTNTFRQLSNVLASSNRHCEERSDAAICWSYAQTDCRAALAMTDAGWIESWLKKLQFENKPIEAHINLMKSTNPAFIPRNYLVEAAINSATKTGDFAPMEELLSVLKQPYLDQPQYTTYTKPPRPEERVCKTFCGT
jgi:uncharacterized protein YdiU (UPF0061 family)